MMIVVLILWVLYSVSEGYEDSQYTFFNNHAPTVWPRLFTGLTVIVSYEQRPLTLKYIALAFVLASVFWFVFELSRNLFKQQYFYYIGSTAKTDRLLKEYEFPIFFLRIFLVGLSLCIYYYEQLLNSY